MPKTRGDVRHGVQDRGAHHVALIGGVHERFEFAAQVLIGIAGED